MAEHLKRSKPAINMERKDQTDAERTFATIDRALSELKTTDQKQYVWRKMLNAAADVIDENTSLALEKSLSQFNIQQTFDKFFRDRKQEKNLFYYKVVSVGLVFLLTGSFLTIAWNIPAIFDNPSSFLWPLMAISGAVLRVIGVCLISTVPAEEYDMFRQTLEPNNSHFKFCVTLGAFLIGLLFFYIYLGQTTVSGLVIQFTCLPFAVWMITAISPNVTYQGFVRRWECSIIIIALFNFAFWTDSLMTAGKQPLLVAEVVIWLCQVLGFFAYVAVGILHRHPDHPSELSAKVSQWITIPTHENWGGHEFNACFYALCMTTFISLFLEGIFMNATGRSAQELQNERVGYLLAAFGDLIPMLLIAWYGPRRCFTLMARYFDNNIERRQKDGSLMAALIESCRDTSDHRVWLKRSIEDSTQPEKGDHDINRRFWIEGERVARPDGVVITFDFDRDLDTSLAALNGDPQPFEKWAECNFSGYPQREVYADRKCVTIRANDAIEQKRVKKTEDLDARKQVLFESGRRTLRFYQWAGEVAFLPELLQQSPRAMSDADKEKTYRLAIEFPIDSRTKIDFFVSHSWSDDPTWKRQELIKFSEEFMQRRGRYPTYWIDKICIDQANPTDGIMALPITIGACRDVLVLMGPTYMKRLWCVWELFTLFTFSNKDLALERIKVRKHPDVTEDVKDFNVDGSHCFDPNEEVKLRHLMLKVVGIETMTESLKHMNINPMASRGGRSFRGSLKNIASLSSRNKARVREARNFYSSVSETDESWEYIV
jgi:hypothetical protein